MLYLSRRLGETIIIDGNIEITIIEVRGKTVKIGIKSPENTTIYRQEVFDKIRDANVASRATIDAVKKVLGTKIP